MAGAATGVAKGAVKGLPGAGCRQQMMLPATFFIFTRNYWLHAGF
jgi:hypothetical protein